jgi:hypothetical protein
MPILKDRHKAPLPEQRKHGIVFASAGDIANRLKCLLMELEAFYQKTVDPEATLIDRYTVADSVECLAIVAGNVPDSYVPQYKGLCLTVLQGAKSLPVGMRTNVIGRQWMVDVKDRSLGNDLISLLIPFIQEKLFSDSMYVPRSDANSEDARVPCGVLLINLYDDVRNSKGLEFRDLSEELG